MDFQRKLRHTPILRQTMYDFVQSKKSVVQGWQYKRLCGRRVQTCKGLHHKADSWICKRTAGTFHRKRSKWEEHGGFLMNKLLSCHYNMDTNRVEARFEDSTALAIDCVAVEDEYGNTPAQRAELDWLLYNKPLEYEVLAKNPNSTVLLPRFSCHTLRHTFTTRMCEAGVNIKVIQDALGHSDISTTLNIYADVTKELRKSEFENLDRQFAQWKAPEE